MIKRKPYFVRSESHKYSRLGKRRKNKQVYRRARGGENKVRLKKRGHLRNVSIGFRSNRKTRGFIKGFKPILVHNMNELKKVTKEQIAIIAHIGNKKRIEFAKYAQEKNIKLDNLNARKFLAKMEKITKEKKELKAKKIEAKQQKKKSSERKAEEKQKKESETEQENMENENESKK
jgi:ribosomal protein L32E